MMKQTKSLVHTGCLAAQVFLSVLLLSGCGNGPAANSQPIGIVRCPRWSGAAPAIDGRLDEAGWQQTVRVALHSRKASGQDGEARLAWDDRYLYIGFFAPDTDVRTTMEGRDKPYWREDVVEAFLRPNELPCYYEIEISPGNQVFDQFIVAPQGTVSRYRAMYLEVDLKLKSAVQVRGTLNNSKDQDEGFTVELAVPFADLKSAPRRPPLPGEVWRCHLLCANAAKGGALFRESSPVGWAHSIDKHLRLEFVGAQGEGDAILSDKGPGRSFQRSWSLADYLHAGRYTGGTQRLNQVDAQTYKADKGYCSINVPAKAAPDVLHAHPGGKGEPLGVTLTLQGPQVVWLGTHLAAAVAGKVLDGLADGVALSVSAKRQDKTTLVLPRTRIYTAQERWLRVEVPAGRTDLQIHIDCGPLNNSYDHVRLKILGDGQAPRPTAAP